MGLTLWLTKNYGTSASAKQVTQLYINGMFNSYVAVYRRVYNGRYIVNNIG